MSRIQFLLVACCIFLLGACQSKGRYVEPQSELDRALVYTEVDSSNKRELHSVLPNQDNEKDSDGGSEEDKSGIASRVPAPAQVDINSLIEIEVNSDMLRKSRLNIPDQQEFDALSTRQVQLQLLLRQLSALFAANAETLDGYEAWIKASPGSDLRDRTWDTFKALRRTSAANGKAVRGLAKELWAERIKDDLVLEKEVDHAFGTLGANTEARDLIQAELESVATKQASIYKRSRFKMRMEAFLQSPGKGVIPLHLPGYDKLPEGKFERRDRWGLALDGAQRTRFEELTRQSIELAGAAEQIRKDGQTVEEAFSNLTGTVLGDFTTLVFEGMNLANSLQPNELKRRLRTTKFDAQVFAESVARRENELLKEHVAAVNKLASDAALKLHEDLHGAIELAEVLASISELKAILDDFDPPSLPRLRQLMSTLPTQAQRVINSGIKPAREQVKSFTTELEEGFEAMSEDVQNIARAEWQQSGLRADLDDWASLVGQVDAFLLRLDALKEIGSFTPIPADLRTPNALEVSLDSAPNTHLDLQLTPRLVGDRLSLRTTILEGGVGVDQTSLATFEIQQFGWHASLDPSVVLAKPDQLSGLDQSFHFAPALSWLHSYTPRPEDSGCCAGFWRATQMSVGPHATFLNFDPEKEMEIGLGLTIGLWDGVLQFGAGWNLNADAQDDGGLYYFAGSSLIAMLQAFQND